ncbi:MAG: TRAP transporter large permease [bacterium]
MLTLVVLIIGVIALFLVGVHVAAGLGILTFLLMTVISDRPMLPILGQIAWNVSSTSLLVVVPMFILMGELLLRGGLSERLYRCFSAWFNWLPGGLLQSNIATCAAFASMSGSTAATAATISRVALPEFRGRNYNEPLTVGSLAAGGTLGVLIPPSIILIVYGVLAEESIGQLYIAGIIPGIVLTLFYMATIFVIVKFRPSMAPREAPYSWSEKIRLSVAILPVAALVFLVLGTIYMGVATVTEAASLGVAGAFLLALVSGKVNRQMLRETFLSTVNTTAMVLLVVSAAFMLTFALAMLGVPRTLAAAVGDLGWSPLAVMCLLIAFYMVLGMFMDAYSMMVTTVPVVLPVIEALGLDLIWFGIVMTLLVEMALISPPHGLNLFILHNVRRQSSAPGEHKTITGLYYGVVPFVLAILLVLGLMMVFPGIATWLPDTMRR